MQTKHASVIKPSKQEREQSRVSAVRNVLANSGSFVYCAIVNFCLAPVVVRELGVSRYGLWVLLTSVIGFLAIMDFGIRGAVMRYIANLHAAGRHDEAGPIASAGLFLFGVLGAIAVSVSLGLAFALDTLFTVPPDLLRVAQWVLIIGGINIAISLVTGVFGGVIAAMQRFDLIGVVEASIETVRACLIVLALTNGYGLGALATIQLSMSLVRCLISVLISRRLYPQLRLALRSWAPAHLRQLLSFSYYSMLLQVSTLMILELDSVIIGTFLPIAMIAYFAIAASLVDHARMLIYAATHSITPHVSAWQATGKLSPGRLALPSGRWATLLLHVMTLTFLFRGETFVRLWMGPSYAELAGPVLFILSLALLFEGGRVVIGATLLGLNQHKALVPVFIVEAICNVALSLLLMRPMGIVGVALGTAVPRIIASAIVIPRVLCRLQNIPVWDAWREIWIRPALAMIPFGLATFAIEHYTYAETLWEFFATVVLVLPLGAIGAWRIGLHESERAGLARAATKLLRATSPSSI